MLNKKISRLCAQFFNARFAPDVQAIINEAYAAHFKLDLSEFAPAASYASLQELFTRRLLKQRQIAQDCALISPCDGTLLSFGRSKANKALTIKNRFYCIDELLFGEAAANEQKADSRISKFNPPTTANEQANCLESQNDFSAAANEEPAAKLSHDDFAPTTDANEQTITQQMRGDFVGCEQKASEDRTHKFIERAFCETPAKAPADASERAQADEWDYINIYLSPRDYHHYHAPCDMQVLEARYFSAALHPVNLASLDKNQNLYAINERVVLRCAAEWGEFYMVFVGALNVGRMNFSFDESIKTNAHLGSFTRSYKGVRLQRGEHLGNFELGSTILFIARSLPPLASELSANSPLKFGAKLSE